MKLNKIFWLFNRLKAMSFKEVLWRVEQKVIENSEEKQFNRNASLIIENIFEDELTTYRNLFDHTKMVLNFNNNKCKCNDDLWLFDKYNYELYKKKWHSGFNTENVWPRIFSYHLDYKQNDCIGDARTNWELNRHFQFTILAKNYYFTGDNDYLIELKNLFYDWNKENPFLIGISWTSVMEVAIRSYSWLITLCFLKMSDSTDTKLEEDLLVGILNMTNYVDKHHSRFSSANNHLLVEMFTLCMVGVLFNNQKWINKSISVLNEELFLQNYSDGVNKEHALHYQTFVMEAMGLVILILRRNNIEYPQRWNSLLERMSEFIADNMDCNEEVSHLGDSDEGKLLDLSGEKSNHFKYVLQLASCLLNKKYVSLKDVHENISWLFTQEEINSVYEIYNNKLSKTYIEGGYSILRNNIVYENEVLIVIDHAELGFGSIAAHGHADSLSFTMTVNGEKIFIDPGTFIYHIDLKYRDYFRRTKNHNTLCINDKDQSQMLGAFLWGQRANTELIESELTEDKDLIIAEHDGYKPIKHRRTYEYNKSNILEIIDNVSGKDFKWINTFVLDCRVKIKEIEDNVIILSTNKNNILMKTDAKYKFLIEDIEISKIYGTKIISKAVRIYGSSSNDLNIKVEIEVL